MLLLHEKGDNYEEAYFDSSDIPFIKYRKDTRQMLILFKKKYRLYLYKDVPRDKFLTLKNSKSLGKAFKEMMKNGRDKELYSVEKLGELNEKDIKLVENITVKNNNS